MCEFQHKFKFSVLHLYVICEENKATDDLNCLTNFGERESTVLLSRLTGKLSIPKFS